MRNIKHFTILEVDNDEAPMIGTIINCSGDSHGQSAFRSRFMDAIHEHFDVKNVKVWEIPDLFDGMHEHDITIQADDNDYKINIKETFLY